MQPAGGVVLQSIARLALRLMIPVTFTVIGIALLFIGGRKVVTVTRATRRFVETEGRVLSARLDEGPEKASRTYAPDVVYEYEYEGEEYSGGPVHPGGTWATGNEDRMRGIVSDYRDRTGERVTVYVDPESPDQSYLCEGRLWHAYVAAVAGALTTLAGVGLVLVVVG